MSASVPLPVHGFVLAGGQSSRMGRDKATLTLQGRPLVAIALQTLRTFCTSASIAGNRDDLAVYGPVVRDARSGTGPVAGLEAGLLHTREAWAIFVPVDVPLVPAALLRTWVDSALARAASGTRVSFLTVHGDPQPAFCLLHRDALQQLRAALDTGERRISRVLHGLSEALGEGSLWITEVETLPWREASKVDLRLCFTNLNTPEDLLHVQGNQEPGPVSVE